MEIDEGKYKLQLVNKNYTVTVTANEYVNINKLKDTLRKFLAACGWLDYQINEIIISDDEAE